MAVSAPPLYIQEKVHPKVLVDDLRQQSQRRAEAEQPEQVKAFRDTWRDGIHSYLTYLRDRLMVARDLLSQSGSIFVQIGDENVHLVRSLLDEVFSSRNFCAEIVFHKTSGLSSKLLYTSTDIILWYAVDKDNVKYKQIYKEKILGNEGATDYKFVSFPDLSIRPITTQEYESAGKLLPKNSRILTPDNLTSQGNSPVNFVFRSKNFTSGWKTNIQGMETLAKTSRVYQRKNSLRYIRYLNDFGVVPIDNSWSDIRWGYDASDKVYVVQTNIRVIERCLLMTTDPGDLVLDPTCGSGTTAYVAEQWGRPLDHHRYFPRGPRSGPCPHYGSPLSLLPTRR